MNRLESVLEKYLYLSKNSYSWCRTSQTALINIAKTKKEENVVYAFPHIFIVKYIEHVPKDFKDLLLSIDLLNLCYKTSNHLFALFLWNFSQEELINVTLNRIFHYKLFALL